MYLGFMLVGSGHVCLGPGESDHYPILADVELTGWEIFDAQD